MNKIARIFVRDIRGIDFINLEITQAFPPYSRKPIFNLGLQKNLAAKF